MGFKIKMSFIPDAVIFSLESIKALVQSIRKTASRVKVNRHQCKTLSDRITRITGLLCADTPKNQLHSALIAIIQDSYKMRYFRKKIRKRWLVPSY